LRKNIEEKNFENPSIWKIPIPVFEERNISSYEGSEKISIDNLTQKTL